MGKKEKNYDDIMNKAYFDACDNLNRREERQTNKGLRTEMQKILRDRGHADLIDKV